uniref:Uncharacterized protein MANES_03G207400 n=1 Tax=Rhizophora mucronata TaxID=61149 RepID=A0A2P2M599_RHIMU
MAISGPITPGQVSFVLGIVPLIAAWIYSEYLEYKKNASASRAHSDIGLVEVQNGTVQEDDKAVLLEGGGLQSASPRVRAAPASSAIFRFIMMDEQFLIDKRLMLRGISEFGFYMAYFYLCDRTDVLGSSKKVLMLLTFFCYPV